ncbi:MAG: ATP synthase subunit I [Rubrivivax sp.]
MANSTHSGPQNTEQRNPVREHREWHDDPFGTEPGAGGFAKPFKPLTRDEAQALRARQPSVSPWRVLAVQALVGITAATLAGLLIGYWTGGGWREEIFWSVLYGAATVVIPGALLARGMTSRLARHSPAAGVASFMVWEMVKLGVSAVMLMLAPKFVPHLNWLALLAGLVLSTKVYWLALSWRGR